MRLLLSAEKLNHLRVAISLGFLERSLVIVNTGSGGRVGPVCEQKLYFLDIVLAGGYPGALDGYQVSFRVPDGTSPGLASIQLKSAWIAGSEVKIASGQ